MQPLYVQPFYLSLIAMILIATFALLTLKKSLYKFMYKDGL